MRSRCRGFLAAVAVVGAVGLVAHASAQVDSRLDFRRPIVERIQPEQRYLLLQRSFSSHPPELGNKSFVTALVDFNPIILTGRVIRKQPAFLDVWNSSGKFAVVPMAEANWIGSRLTVLIVRVIQTETVLTLAEGNRLDFIWEHYGSTIINGTRVDAETESLWPVDEGKRYLIVGRLMELGGSMENC